LDDFGVGYSSLSHLHRLPIDIIKVDRSFVRDVADNAAGSIIDLIIALGRRLDIETVAEGVEEESQAERLRLMRCTRAQGFLFATPMPADDVAGYLGAAGSMSRAAAQPDHGPGLLGCCLRCSRSRRRFARDRSVADPVGVVPAPRVSVGREWVDPRRVRTSHQLRAVGPAGAVPTQARLRPVPRAAG
jgi:hypothetical protein